MRAARAPALSIVAAVVQASLLPDSQELSFELDDMGDSAAMIRSAHPSKDAMVAAFVRKYPLQTRLDVDLRSIKRNILVTSSGHDVALALRRPPRLYMEPLQVRTLPPSALTTTGAPARAGAAASVKTSWVVRPVCRVRAGMCAEGAG